MSWPERGMTHDDTFSFEVSGSEKKKKESDSPLTFLQPPTPPTSTNPQPTLTTQPTMEILTPVVNSSGEMDYYASEDRAQTTRTLAMESEELVGETTVLPQSSCCSASTSLDQDRKSCHGLVKTYEPLKVCLDDDSSIEDGDEDMFDDDAFTFGDEDFQAIMSHEALKRMSPSINPIPHGHGRPAAQTSCCTYPQNSFFLPSHQSAPLLIDKVADISADSSPAASSVCFLGGSVLLTADCFCLCS
jgi:hypothetical protein